MHLGWFAAAQDEFDAGPIDDAEAVVAKLCHEQALPRKVDVPRRA